MEFPVVDPRGKVDAVTVLQPDGLAGRPIILGATGAGKTYLACALGMATSRGFYPVRYIRLPDLLVEISVARASGTYRDFMKRLKKEKLLILDEWLLYPLKDA